MHKDKRIDLAGFNQRLDDKINRRGARQPLGIPPSEVERPIVVSDMDSASARSRLGSFTAPKCSPQLIRFLTSDGAMALASWEELYFPQLTKRIYLSLALLVLGFLVLGGVLFGEFGAFYSPPPSYGHFPTGIPVQSGLYVLNPGYFFSTDQMGESDYRYGYFQAIVGANVVASINRERAPKYIPVKTLEEAQRYVDKLVAEGKVITLTDGKHIDVKRDIEVLKAKKIIVDVTA